MATGLDVEQEEMVPEIEIVWGVGVGEGEPKPRRAGSLLEQQDSFVGEQRRHTPREFTGQAQRFTAGA